MAARRATLLLLIQAMIITGCGGGGGGGTGSGTTGSAGGVNPKPTALGVSTGAASSATIGAAGGTLATADGAVKLTIPADALSADTTIGIQPITNFAINGTGSAYRLTPEGTTFAKPVTLTFTYDDALVAGSAPQALEVATQDAQGYWRLAPSPTRDLNTKTVSVTIPHFSDWSPIEGLQLSPRSATLNVNESQDLSVVSCDENVTTTGGPGDDELAWPLYDCSSGLLGTPASTGNWAVDGAPGGTTGTGLVAPSATSPKEAHYTAPAKTPAPATVAVSINATGTKYGTLVLVSNITILGGGYAGTLDIPAGDAAGNYDAQHVEVTWTRADPDPLSSQGGATYYGTGYWTTTLLGTSANCEPQTVTAALATDGAGTPTSYLEVYGGNSPLAGKYRFTILTVSQPVTLTCFGLPAATAVSQNILADGCPSDADAGAQAPAYTDATQLVRTSGFDVATGAPADPCVTKMKASWKFTAK